MNAETGDLILIVADKNSVVFKSLGELRLELSRKFDLVKDKNEFNFTWITEFPLSPSMMRKKKDIQQWMIHLQCQWKRI